ncbi:odorant receptor 49b-like [Cylas formicarius]|uniref:odorant receptor 49b-like n=1 Tax=Cylas formicarius TaxID=197179 RepID=UPI00295853E4|nr:odorant receptor 49b-like [Cylas formicarius]
MLKLSRYSMTVAGIWRSPFPYNSIYQIYSSFVRICYLISLALMYAYLFDIFAAKGTAIDEPADFIFTCIAYLISLTVVQIKAALCQSDKFLRLLRRIQEAEDDLFRLNEPEIASFHSSQVRFARKINLVVFFFNFCFTAELIIANLFQRTAIEEHNRVFNTTLEKRFVFQWYYGSIDTEAHEMLLLVVNGFSLTLAACMTFATHCVYFSSTFFASSPLGALGIRLKKAASYAEDGLVRLIKDYQDVIEYVQYLNASTKYVLMMDYALNSLNMALIIFLFLKVDTYAQWLSVVSYAGYLMTNIFATGWAANEIKMQGLRLSDAIYESSWYNYDKELKRHLLMVMIRAQKPLVLTIGPFGEMVLQSSLTIMKAAYSYSMIMIQKY